MSIEARNVEKWIGSVCILKKISLLIQSGEFVALTGKSGSGKSTLLYLLSSLDLPTSGEILLEGQRMDTMPVYLLNRLRNEKMGFIFQFHYLIAELSALENVLLPTRKTQSTEMQKSRAHFLLDSFGLGNKTHRLPRELSGGEQQRVAIARALLLKPRYVFADEPTGSLDSKNGQFIMNYMQEMNQKERTTFLLATHDEDFARLAHRQIRLSDGKILS